MNKATAPPDPAERRRRRRPVPKALRWLRWSFAWLERLAPAYAARRAERVWFHARRYPEPAREAQWRAAAHAQALEFKGQVLMTYRWGNSGPLAVLVHGWSGRGPQLGAFATALVAAGYQVLAFDAPGHGRSGGHSTHAFDMAAALQHVVSGAQQPVQTVIAHSFGVLVTALALRQGLKARSVVCLSSPTDLKFLVQRFCQALHIGPRSQRNLERRIERRFGTDVWRRVAADENARGSTVPALIIHDENDHDVPCELSERLAQAWPQARLLRTRGLGHRRILRHRDTIAAVLHFLVQHDAPATSQAVPTSPAAP